MNIEPPTTIATHAVFPDPKHTLLDIFDGKMRDKEARGRVRGNEMTEYINDQRKHFSGDLWKGKDGMNDIIYYAHLSKLALIEIKRNVISKAQSAPLPPTPSSTSS